MSLGYCGRMELFIEDEEAVIYRYTGANLNDETETGGDMDSLDGEIIIHKRCLIEPEIHLKMKKTTSHRKVLRTKRVIQPFDLDGALQNGDIEILKLCISEKSNDVHISVDQPYFAKRLLGKLLTVYQENGKLPAKCSFFV